ncbi:hypothetical protein OH77DRAFT_1585142 [Trametes cingulata]|nr:hypothetical protein OH77DRAFT_1585142 [Trametes cingulata]
MVRTSSQRNPSRSDTDTGPTMEDLQQEDSEKHAGPRYTTRKSTQNRRPGVEAGLAKRTKATAAAQKKRSAQEDIARRKAQEHEAQAERLNDGEKRLARLLDRRAREDAIAQQRMYEVPLIDDGDNTNAQDNGNFPRPREDAPKASSNDSTPRSRAGELSDGTTRDHEDMYAHHEDDGDYEPPVAHDGEDWEDDCETASGTDDIDGIAVVARKARKAKTSTAPSQKAPRTRKSAHAGPTPPAQAAKKSMTAAEKKQKRVQEVRGGITAWRETPPSTVPAKRVADKRVPAQSQAKKSKQAADAFTPDYRKAMRERAVAASSRDAGDEGHDSGDELSFIGASPPPRPHPQPKSAPTLPLSNGAIPSRASLPTEGSHVLTGVNTAHRGTPTRAVPASDSDDDVDDSIYARRQAERHPTPLSGFAPLSDEEIGGLDDIDVHSRRPSKQPTGASRPNPMVAVIPNAAIDGDTVKPPSKRPRTPKNQVPPEMSRGVMGLPDWVQPTMLTKIVPSLVKHYGAQDDPWDLDHASRTHFLTVLGSIVRRVHPDQQLELTRSHKIYTFARQKVYEWRKGFQKTAIKLVAAARNARVAQGETHREIAQWVSDALANGGEATYAYPNVQSPDEARGALQSAYIVKLLAYHLHATEGAVLRESYPVSALALSIVALRRAFKMFKTGVFVEMDEEFGEKTVGQATAQARKGTVEKLCERPGRVAGLIEKAWLYVPEDEQVAAAKAVEDDDIDAFEAFDPSSSPTHG